MEESKCLNCGLPLTRNPHPEAGTIPKLNTLGAMWGCLPCAERRATGRRRMFCELSNWLEDQENKTRYVPLLSDVYKQVRTKLNGMEEQRRQDFRKQDLPNE